MKKLMMTLAIALVAGFAISACSNTEKKTEAPAKVEKKEDPAHHQPNMNAEVLEPYQCGDVQRLHTLGGVFLASQPQPTDFEQASMGGIKLVVNMRHESEIKDFNEREVVTKYGMEYINLPWNGAAELTDKIFDEGRRIFRDETRPMLVHCSSSNRVGAIWLAYRVLDNGVSFADALQEAKTVGMKTPAYETMAKAYIEKNQK